MTVFERTDYVIGAIESALNQTVPVKVIVVEDCARTTQVRDLVTARFGNCVKYIRNAERQGIFGNWNACCEEVTTDWISILHDDDFLHPNFVESMVRLGQLAGPKGVYFSRTSVLDERDVTSTPETYDFPGQWRLLDLRELARRNPVLFPGQLLNVGGIQQLGGFMKNSQFAGDWDMWFKLAFHFGAAQTRDICATVRTHQGFEKGTNKVVRAGRNLALDFVQSRRNFNLLRSLIPEERFSKEEILRESPSPLRQLFAIAPNLSPRMAHYQWGLLLKSKPPHLGYSLVRWFAALAGSRCFQRAITLLRQMTDRDR